jgi:sugar lactone lactonase YvrE
LALVPVSLTLFGITGAQNAGVPVMTGLNGPQGVLVGPDGGIWAIDSGVGGPTEVTVTVPQTGMKGVVKIGNTARVVRLGPDGKQTDVATLPSVLTPDGEATGGGRLAVTAETVYATSGSWSGDIAKDIPERMPLMASILKIADGKATEVASTWDLERTQNPDKTEVDTHPYGLTTGSDGQLWIADAGGNSLEKLDPVTGTLSVVAVFDGLPWPKDLPVPPPLANGNPSRGGKLELDPVPTAVVPETDGGAYVSLLCGFPFPVGVSRVVRVSKDGKVSDFATNPKFSMLTDLRRGPDGNLYAVSFGRFEFGPQGPAPVPNAGAVWRITPDGQSSPVLEGLSFPTSIDFNQNGDAYLAINGVGAPGSGSVVRYDKLAAKP